MRDLWKIKDMLCNQLEEYAQRTKLAGGELQTVHMLTDTIKNIDKIGKRKTCTQINYNSNLFFYITTLQFFKKSR